MFRDEEFRISVICHLLALGTFVTPVLIVSYGVVLPSLLILLVLASFGCMGYGIFPHWRIWQRLYAATHAYYWVACPICHRYYGGHEASGSWYQGRGRGQSVCINCKEPADEMSRIVLERESKEVYHT